MKAYEKSLNQLPLFDVAHVREVSDDLGHSAVCADQADHQPALDVESSYTPVAVSLADRAMALNDIFTYYSKYAQTKRSEQQLTNPDSEFSRRYGAHARDVQAGAEYASHRLLDAFNKATRTLIAADALHDSGMSNDDIELHRVALQHELNATYNTKVTKTPHAARRRKATLRRVNTTLAHQ